MDAKKGLFISGLLFLVLLVVSLFAQVEVFTRANGEVTSFTAPAHADFSEDGVIRKIHFSEGELVSKGAILAELDNEEQKINLDIFLDKKARTEKKLRILQALLDEEQLELSVDGHRLEKQVERFLLISSNYQDSVRNLEELVAIDQRKKQAMEALVSKNAAGSMLTVESIQKMLRDRKDLLKVKKEFEERIVFEIERYEELLSDVNNSIRLYKHYIEQSYVRAPVSGVVRHVYFSQEGKFISRGDTFAEIIEDTPQPYKITLNVPASEIGMIKTDTDVRMRLDTYDHTIFGFLEGTISRISVDRLEEEGNDFYYRVEVIPDRHYLESRDRRFPLKYGMTLYGTI
ncbi:MAG: HlyD family efflux transporter periplasmic adaptor subunit, partial [Endozoicomonas sp.]